MERSDICVFCGDSLVCRPIHRFSDFLSVDPDSDPSEPKLILKRSPREAVVAIDKVSLSLPLSLSLSLSLSPSLSLFLSLKAELCRMHCSTYRNTLPPRFSRLRRWQISRQT